MVRGEPNAQIHAVATVLLVIVCWTLRVTPLEGAVLAVAAGAVWAAEALNTALEILADRVTRETDPHIRDAKDVAAAAALLTAIAATVAAACILLPKIRAALYP